MIAPTPTLMDQHPRPHATTNMSQSPNIRLEDSTLKSSSEGHTTVVKSTGSCFVPDDGINKFITIGKDCIAVPIPSMVSINNNPPYLKAPFFHTLSTVAYRLLDTYNPPSVMMFMSQQLPIDTSMALTESAKIEPAIKSNMLDMHYGNLQATSFVKHNWIPATTEDNQDLSKRGRIIWSQIQEFHWWPVMDTRGIVDSMPTYHTDFVLLLPQHTYYPTDSKVIEVSSPMTRPPPLNRQLFNSPQQHQKTPTSTSVSTKDPSSSTTSSSSQASPTDVSETGGGHVSTPATDTSSMSSLFKNATNNTTQFILISFLLRNYLTLALESIQKCLHLVLRKKGIGVSKKIWTRSLLKFLALIFSCAVVK